MTVKVLATEISLPLTEDLDESGETVSSATVVRLVNTGNASSKVIITDSSATAVGSLTLPGGESIILQKSSSHNLSVESGTVVAVKVAHSN